MSFSDIPPVESAAFYMDLSLRRARENCDQRGFGSIRDPLLRNKKKSGFKLRAMCDELRIVLDRILKTYPRVDELTPFYQDLIKTTIDYPYLKRSFGAIIWSLQKIQEFETQGNRKISASRNADDVIMHHKKIIGRLASIMKQLQPHLEFLETARKVFRSYPTIKHGMKTICIAGFPNVGKSTLLSKVTPATPEINEYAFTTKGLNLGYMKFGHEKVQFIDTPGTLDRPEKMNVIEKQAHLVMKHEATHIVYVFDVMNEVAIEDQERLYKRIKKLEKPVLLYLTKLDIAPKADVDAVVAAYPEIITNLADLDVQFNKIAKEKSEE